MAPLYLVGLERMFREGDIVGNKYLVGLVKCSKVQRCGEYCCFIYR